MRRFVCVTLAVLAMTTSVCLAAAPEPAVVPGSDNWTIDVKFEHPQQIAVQLNGNSKSKLFWYTIITLTNKTKRDVDFYPCCELMTDTFQVIPAGSATPEAVLNK